MKSYRLLLFVLFFAIPFFGFSQEKPMALTYQSGAVGLGFALSYDSYLSPLPYNGLQISGLSEKIKPTAWFDGKILTQELFDVDAAMVLNPTGTALMYAAALRYSYGGFYRFQPVKKVQLFAGMQAEASAGCLYNPRNSNNPVNAKLHLNWNLSGMAAYRFRIYKQPIQLRYQFELPVCGMLFSPEYGQSYYEIGLGDSAPLLHFARWGNQFIFRNLLTIEVPVFQFCVRLSYLNSYHETSINQLDTKMQSNMLLLGFSRYFHTVSSKKLNPKKYDYVFQ